MDSSVEWLGVPYYPLADDITINNAETMTDKEKLYKKTIAEIDELYEAVIYTGRIRKDIYSSRHGEYAPFIPEDKTVFPNWDENKLGDMETQFVLLKNERQNTLTRFIKTIRLLNDG